MGSVTDFDEEFEKYFYALEGFALRAERFYEDCDQADSKTLRKWLHAAFLAGARVAADDSVDALRDYATAVAGLTSKISREEGYDNAASGLNVYFAKVLGDAEAKLTK